MSVGILKFLVITLPSFWLASTCLINFVIIRLIFSEIDSFFVAGTVGMKLFTTYNKIELFFAFAMILSIGRLIFKNQFPKLLFLLGIPLLIIPLFYEFYLTSKISELTILWEKADLMGINSINGIPDIQQEHQFFHRLYIVIDSVKLILISFSLILCSIFSLRSK